jgi:hypothetical protein
MTRLLLPRLAIYAIPVVGATVGISRPPQCDMPRDLPEMSQIADFGRFYYRYHLAISISRCDGRNMPTVAPTYNCMNCQQSLID